MNEPAAGQVPRLSASDTALVGAQVLGPLVARGVIKRRPKVVEALERADADRRGVERLRRIRDRYGPGPVRLRLPARNFALVLDPTDARRVLDQTPEPFAPANLEKRGALSHFQTTAVLISHGAAREDRRRFNEIVLNNPADMHQLAATFARVIDEELSQLLVLATRVGKLSFADFLPAWYRVVRRVILGDGARDDHQLTDDLALLRNRANWSYLAPKSRRVRRRFQQRLRAHVDAAEPGSIAGLFPSAPSTEQTDPAGQVPHWLFAFEPAAIALWRTLALLATHPLAAQRLRSRPEEPTNGGPPRLGGVRAAVLESLRLWPTTPALLRDTTTTTQWRDGQLASGAALLIVASFFHRDEEHVPGAHRFRPDRWDASEPQPHDDWPLVPFSDGPGACPGRNLVLLTTSLGIDRLLTDHRAILTDPSRVPADRDLPSVLNPFTLELKFERR